MVEPREKFIMAVMTHGPSILTSPHSGHAVNPKIFPMLPLKHVYCEETSRDQWTKEGVQGAKEVHSPQLASSLSGQDSIPMHLTLKRTWLFHLLDINGLVLGLSHCLVWSVLIGWWRKWSQRKVSMCETPGQEAGEPNTCSWMELARRKLSWVGYIPQKWEKEKE